MAERVRGGKALTTLVRDRSLDFATSLFGFWIGEFDLGPVAGIQVMSHASAPLIEDSFSSHSRIDPCFGILFVHFAQQQDAIESLRLWELNTFEPLRFGVSTPPEGQQLLTPTH